MDKREGENMRYNKIRKMDISDGPGVRVSLFVQGCHFHCFNCFNPETHDFNGGKEFTDETIETIMKLCEKDYIVGLSILGGEPMEPVNRDDVTRLAKRYKLEHPDKTIWMWSGYRFEQLKGLEVLSYIDVLVDGVFIDELHDFSLEWRGSSNQRVIDVRQSLIHNKIVLYPTKN